MQNVILHPLSGACQSKRGKTKIILRNIYSIKMNEGNLFKFIVAGNIEAVFIICRRKSPINTVFEIIFKGHFSFIVSH